MISVSRAIMLAPGGLVTGFGLLSGLAYLRDPGDAFGWVASGIVVCGLVLVAAGALLPLRLQHSALVLTASLFCYLALEAGTTAYHRLKWLDTTLWLSENSDRTVRFDAIRGTFLGQFPARCARITNGVVEYVGVIRGNAQGFPDRDDFTAQRPPDVKKRYAVFGDSFTEARFLNINWPDRVEDKLSRREVQLLNLAIHGGGLANWWSILTKLITAEDYDLDGVIFVVWDDDLHRRMHFVDHSVTRHNAWARWSKWDPTTYPTSVKQIEGYLQKTGHVLSTEEFDRALVGHWPDSVPKPPIRPALTTQTVRFVKQVVGLNAAVAEQRPVLGSTQKRLIAEIARIMKARQWRGIVITVPPKQELLGADIYAGQRKDEIRNFAKAIGASFCDGAQAFNGLPRDQVERQFFSYDLHWNQEGSDRFAAFMVRVLRAEACQLSARLY